MITGAVSSVSEQEDAYVRSIFWHCYIGFAGLEVIWIWLDVCTNFLFPIENPSFGVSSTIMSCTCSDNLGKYWLYAFKIFSWCFKRNHVLQCYSGEILAMCISNSLRRLSLYYLVYYSLWCCAILYFLQCHYWKMWSQSSKKWLLNVLSQGAGFKSHSRSTK